MYKRYMPSDDYEDMMASGRYRELSSERLHDGDCVVIVYDTVEDQTFKVWVS